MKQKMAVLMTVCVAWTAGAEQLFAQRGVGNPTGVARQAEKPEVISLAGKLKAIQTGPCEATTGCSPIGTHILLETVAGEELNIHLGPAAAVDELLDQLVVGQQMTVEAFRTSDLKEHHYVARAIAFDGTSIELRDESLRPFWARGDGGFRRFAQASIEQGAGTTDSTFVCGRRHARGTGCGFGCLWGCGRSGGSGLGLGRGFVDADRDGVCDHLESGGRQARRGRGR